jgi:HAE1 family hydrophobic/amphiphilic exporter-1
LNVRGQPFKLGDVATVSASSSLTSISHIDQKRAVTVSAAVEKPYLPAEVLAKFKEEMKSRPLPTGYEIEFGGQNDTNTESILSILRAMIVAMVLIVGTLVIQFNSFRKAIMVLATIPLALTGVFIGFAATGFTLSFPSLIGILALFGIVVKNAVIMVDKINLNLKVGIEFVDAIVDAAKSRMEAIFLTSICTIIGMIPITVSSETWAGLGMALIFGLLASTFLTLFVMPILFSILMKKSNDKDVKLRQLKALAEDKVGLRS